MTENKMTSISEINENEETEPYAVTYGLYSDLDTGTVKSLVALETRNLARGMKKGELPGSGWGDAAEVLPGFDNVNLVAQNRVNETLRKLRHNRSAMAQPEPGLFQRLTEASRLRAALGVVLALGIGTLAITEAWNYGDSSAQQYVKNHPHAVQSP